MTLTNCHLRDEYGIIDKLIYSYQNDQRQHMLFMTDYINQFKISLMQISVMIFFNLFFLHLSLSKVYNTQSPVWITSPYFRSGNQAVIKTLTGSTQHPSHTFTFSSSLPGLPNLAYGIKGYTPNDWMGQQRFEIQRVNLTASTFTVSIQIVGITNLWILNVAYIAIDPNFPHHLNSFDNVPLNYTSGPLTNFSVKSSTPLIFTQLINYTSQAANRKYSKFQEPLFNNKIILFMTSLYIEASFRTSQLLFPIDLQISLGITNTTHYWWSLSLTIQVFLQKLHFSQIIFNEEDVKKSKKYFIVYELWITDANGGFKPIPPQFDDNFIMGIVDFKTIDGKCAFQYTWEFQTVNSVYGVTLKPSSVTFWDCAFSYIKTSVLYMKTWQCNPPFNYFNLTSDLCQDMCTNQMYQNTTDYSCDYCYSQCVNCQPNKPNSCTQCNATQFRQLNINNQCVCKNGYYQIASKCINCWPITGCLICKNQTYCKECDISNGYILNTTTQVCVCNVGYYQIENSKCAKCNISTIFGCLICKNQTHCLTCNAEKWFTLNNSQCICMDNYVLQNNTCVCMQGYYLINNNTRQCGKCPEISGCKICKNERSCKTCVQSSQYTFNPYTQLCDDVSETTKILKAVVGFGLVSAFIMLALKNSLPTAQLVSCIQMCYLSLGTVDNLHPILVPIYSNLRHILGYNSNFSEVEVPNEITQLPIKNINFQTSFFHNINVMLLIQVILLVLTVALMLMLYKWPNLKKIYRIAQKELFIVVIFNALNIIFSFPLISKSYQFQVFVGIFSLIVIICQYIHMYIYGQQYYGFSTTFNSQSNYKEYLIAWLLCRLLSSIFISSLKQAPYTASYLILMIECLILILIIKYQPFIQTSVKICVIMGESWLLLFLLMNVISNPGYGQAQTKLTIAILQIIALIFLGITTLISAISSLVYGLMNWKSENVVNNISEQSKQQQKKQQYKSDKKSILNNIEVNNDNEINNTLEQI